MPVILAAVWIDRMGRTDEKKNTTGRVDFVCNLRKMFIRSFHSVKF